MKQLFATFACTLALLSPFQLFASEVRNDASTQRSAEKATVCRTTSTDMDFAAGDASFSGAQRSFNAHLDELNVADPSTKMKRAQEFRVSESAEYFSVSVDAFACDEPGRRAPRSGKADSSSDGIQARSSFDGGTIQTCDYVGCVEGWPGGSAPNGSTMTLTQCETLIKTTITYKKINGQWTVTSYKQEQVVECGPLT